MSRSTYRLHAEGADPGWKTGEFIRKSWGWKSPIWGPGAKNPKADWSYRIHRYLWPPCVADADIIFFVTWFLYIAA